MATLSAPVRTLRVAGALLAAGALAAAPASGQSPIELAASCVSGTGDVGLCLGAATSAWSLSGHQSLLASAGSPIPGTASNLGTRVGGGPRLAFHAQLLASSWGLPDPADPGAETSSVVTGFRLGAAAGLFDGFRLMPTVGGFLATDVFGDVAFLSPGEEDGYAGGARSFGLGARIGLFREGFTIPGASISIARRFGGSLEHGDVSSGDATGVTIDPGSTSVRLTASKDLFGVQLLGGFGVDDVGGDATLRVSDGSGGVLVTSGELDGGRKLYFGSASMTFSLIFTLTLEGGWAEGMGAVAGYDGSHDPASGSGFGGVSARLVF